MMERKIARDFQTVVKTLLGDDNPETIYAVLKAYHQVSQRRMRRNKSSRMNHYDCLWPLFIIPTIFSLSPS